MVVIRNQGKNSTIIDRTPDCPSSRSTIRSCCIAQMESLAKPKVAMKE